jgi:hypothetical protein
VDDNQGKKINVEREHIVDMNYPGPWTMFLGSRYDSSKKTAFYQQLRNLNKPLLIKDINDIKILVNEALQLRIQIRIRRDFELPRLVKEATDLIQVLETEYHLN